MTVRTLTEYAVPVCLQRAWLPGALGLLLVLPGCSGGNGPTTELLPAGTSGLGALTVANTAVSPSASSSPPAMTASSTPTAAATSAAPTAPATMGMPSATPSQGAPSAMPTQTSAPTTSLPTAAPTASGAPPSEPGGSSAGCGAATPLESGTFSIDVDGAMREYVLDVPEDYDPAHPYRLVFVWHPLGGSASQVVRGNYDGLKPLSDGTAIFVAPDGLEGMAAGITGQGWYNTGGGDIAFLHAMLDHFNANLCIDSGKIFSSGFSFGGMMSYAIGCELADVFRAIAPASGNTAASGCKQSNDHPIAVLGLHGDADDFVATSGGRTARDIFVERNHCEATTAPYDPSPCVEYQGCDEGYPVIWCEFPGGHNPWSKAPPAIWDFFSQF